MASLVLLDATPLSGPESERGLGTCVGALIRALWAGALAAAVPSRIEGFSVPALAAMAHGLPIIASGIPAPGDALASTGPRVHDFAPRRWAETLDGPADDVRMRGDLAAGSDERATTLSRPETGEGTRAAYAEVCDG